MDSSKGPISSEGLATISQVSLRRLDVPFYVGDEKKDLSRRSNLSQSHHTHLHIVEGEEGGPKPRYGEDDISKEREKEDDDRRPWRHMRETTVCPQISLSTSFPISGQSLMHKSGFIIKF